MRPSIDLAAELESITRRQHLNDVHFTVALVRHAARARPRRIEVRLGRNRITLSHDGRPLDPAEPELLLAVLSDQPDEVRQRALAELERRFGVALLSALATSTAATLECSRSIVVEEGRARPAREVRDRGWSLHLRRPLPRPRDARHELAFYCAHAPFPIVVDGKDLTRPLQLRETLLHTRFRNASGEGLCGLPLERALSRVRYFKHGIYFGVRASLPSDGRAVEAMFNSNLDEVEDNFRRSISAANRAVREGRIEVYDEAARRFTDFPEADRAVLARAFLRIPPDHWTDALREAPLLHTTEARWARSLNEVKAEGERGIVPYALRAAPGLKGLLLLTPDEVRAVRKLTGVQLRRALASPPPPPPLRDQPGAAAAAPDERERRLIEQVARLGVELILTDGGQPARAGRRLSLPRRHPILEQALRAPPDRAELVALALLGAADPLVG